MEETFSLSTSWNIFRYTDAGTFINELAQVGFNRVEFNYRVTQKIVDDLLPYIENGKLIVTSLHNYCPRPVIPDDIRSKTVLSSTNEEFRRQAVKYTQDTLSLAHQLGVKAIVVHCGDVEGLDTLWQEVNMLFQEGKQQSEEFQKLKTKLWLERKQNKGPYLQACEKSINDLSEFIMQKGYNVKIGLENRYYYHEIPIVEDYDEWFAKMKDYPIGLWYDIGHGEVEENLTLDYSRQLLKKYQHLLLGFHIHDTDGTDDHYAPGMKKTKFDLFREYLKPDLIKVLEFRSSLTPNEIMDGVKFLKEKLQ